MCIKDYNHLKLKGNIEIESKSKSKEIITITITKCKGSNCAKEKEIDNYINRLILKREAIYENINYQITGHKPVQKVVIPNWF